MTTNNPLNSQQIMKSQQDYLKDPKKFIYLAFSKWHYFLITLIVAIACAYLYISKTLPTYRVTATILIDEEKKGGLLGSSELLEGLGFGAGKKNLDNQIMVLSSRTLIERTLDELVFDIEYYHRGLFNKIALYPDSPIKVVPQSTENFPRDIEFSFQYLDNNLFNIAAKSKDTFDINTQALFGSDIQFPGGSFRIEKESNDWFEGNKNRKIYFIFHSREKLVESYSERLEVEPLTKLGTTVRISLEGTNKTMDMDFMNMLTDIFLNTSLDKKNLEAIRTIQFIDDQLIGISDSLVITENKLQQFRSRNRVMNLSAQGQVIIDQAMSLENEKARLEIEANYYEYLAEYLAKDNADMAPIAPATMGITDPGLTRLVADLADLQGKFYSRSLGEKNPIQSQLAQRVRNTKEALRETLNGVRRANNLAISEINNQIRTVNAQASALPVTERELLGIERKFKLNDELYTFLLEKRAAAQIQKASNMPDNEVIDPAKPDTEPVKPEATLIFAFALMAGIGLPFIWLLVFDAFSTKVKDHDDINNLTDLPISGQIPHSQQKINKVVFDDPQSIVSEAFRSLRSKMQFFTKEIKVPVILITSSMPEEGKTFTAINLASVYSLMGKKTVLIGFDMRRPKIYSDFGLNNEKGVSTWLIGEDGLKDIIKETSYENLFIIPAGPIPPNPAELISLEKVDELIGLLKEMFECIIIDSSPIGLVSDTFHLASLSDACLLMVRRNKTNRHILESTLKELKTSDIKSVSLVFNDMVSNYKGYGYNYTSDKEKGK